MRSEKLWLVAVAVSATIAVAWGFDVEGGRWLQQAVLIVAGMQVGLLVNNIFRGDE